MTNNPQSAPSFERPRPLVLFLAFPGMCLLDLAGPQTVFWCASQHMAQRGLAGYTRRTASLDGGVVNTLEGVGVDTEALAGVALEQVDTIVVPGTPHMLATLDGSAPLVAWLRAAGTRVRRIASVCTGAFLLAEAGLLDGKRAATHWAMCAQLAARYPAIDVDDVSIFVEHGGTWTSAGVTAGLDLAMAMVEADAGRAVALAVARELVVFVKRPGGQPQLSMLLEAQSNDGAGFDALHLWIADNLGTADLSVEALATHVQMSPRNFTRVYKLKTGQTPARAVETFRLEAARRLLEDSERNIDQIALHCGFGDEERMRLTFQRHLGLSPRQYRQQLLTPTAGSPATF